MKRYLPWLCIVLASAAIAAPPQVVVRGTVTTSSGQHPAWFTLICTQGRGGALSMQLTLGAESAPDFPFDAFEGPRAPASFQPSATLKVDRRSFAPVAVVGWYSGDTDGAFVFGVASIPRSNATLNQIAAALDEPNVTLTWEQLSNNLQTPPLVAQFSPDPSQSGALKRIAAPCLPQPVRH